MTDPTARLNSALEGRYRIEREIGEGGMATVYLAHDERHKRPVALKVLKPELAAVVGAERFLAEIETTANLQHPHILPLFDSGEADGFLFYVMPYIEGETLRERLDRERQLPVDEALGIATAVANALQVAHEAGVVHRDIKPGNILLSRGEPLVADFGIALAVGGASGTRLTETGLSIGTPYYMSPEQATGDQAVGPSSDTFALACVLYEMLVGEPPYPGSTAQAVLGKIIQGAPVSATAVRRSIPLNVDAAIRKALERIPADRFRSAKAFADALADPSFRYGASPAGVAADAAGWRRAVYGLAALSLVLALLSGWALTRSEPPRPTVHASIRLPEPLGGAWGTMALSPDGSLLVYEGPAEDGDASTQLWLRRGSALNASPIPGTKNASSPSISPNGREVAFLQFGTSTLMVTSLDGGVPRTLVESGVHWGGEWSPDGFIYFTTLGERGIARVPAQGGPVESLTTPTEGAQHLDPVMIEDHGVLLFWEPTPSEFLIRALDISSGDTVTLTSSGGTPKYLPTGHLAYVSITGELMVAPFDPGRMEMTGPAVPMVRNLLAGLTRPPSWAVSETGTVVYASGTASRRYQVRWVDRRGASTPVDPGWSFDPGSNNRGLALSPDGSRLAITILGETAEDIWIKELPDGPLLRLTSDSAQDVRPRWAGDDRITFISERDGPPAKAYVIPAGGTGRAELILEHDLDLWEAQLSADEGWILGRTGGTVNQVGGRDIIGAPLGGDAEPVPLIATDFDEKAIRLSPDGRWLAYESNRTGRNEVYVRPFPEVDTGLTAISVDGGVMPLWAPDGSAIYYVTSANQMVEARVTTEPSFRVTGREALFTIEPDLLIPQGEQYTLYDITPDGERFIMMGLMEAEDAEVILITNWFTEVEERVGR